MPQSKKPTTGQNKTAPMLILPVLLLTACGATSPVCPPASAPLPAPPLMSTPLPQQSYSSSAAQKLQSWRVRLMGTQMMRE